MLLVRFSFCECGSVVCMSPRPAQRSVLASASTAASASAAASAAANGARREADRIMGLLRERGRWARLERARLPMARDHSAARGRRAVESAAAARMPRRRSAHARTHVRQPPRRSSPLGDGRRTRLALARRIERARARARAGGRWARIAAATRALGRAARQRARRAPSRRSPIRRSCRSRSAPTRSRARSATHPVVIVCGETGSGKTTQLPKICLAAGRGERGLIGHTQPRRIAARAVATRIAQELGHAARRGRRLQGPLHRPHAARRVRQADDRRHPARRDAGRPRCSPPTTRSSSTRRTSAASTSTSCWAT